jgi:hypothetical protein
MDIQAFFAEIMGQRSWPLSNTAVMNVRPDYLYAYSTLFEGRLPGSIPCHVGFMVDKVAWGQVSLDRFGFPCLFPFLQMLHTYPSSGAGKMGALVADVRSALSHIAVQWLRLALSKGPNRIGFFPHLRTETDPVSETSWFSLVCFLIPGRWIKSENPISLKDC